MCHILLPIYKRKRKSLFLGVLLLILIAYRKDLLDEILGPPNTKDAVNKDKFLDPVVAQPCKYPDFVIREKYQLFDPKDPTSRARVGPSPKAAKGSNFTVIYNFASPEPVKKLGNSDQEDDDEDEELYKNEINDFDGTIDEDHLTLVTHATPEYLPEHLPTLLKHWPNHSISLSIFAPGEDFCSSSALISWFWNCHIGVSKQVSFHVFFPSDFSNDVASKTASEGIQILDVDCNSKPFVRKPTYRHSRSLPYPINTARNVARSAARTKYFLTTDIEFIPSNNLADNFIKLSQKIASKNKRKNKNDKNKVVYVVPTFEIESAAELPANKAALVTLYKQDKVVLFHKFICPHCQTFPRFKDWLKRTKKISSTSVDKRVRIFHSARRSPPFHRWEPLFIGTHDDPLYDERLTWEGFQDKMSQAHEMCLLNYKFSILDNAFLVHSGGILQTKPNYSWRESYQIENNKTYYKIVKELEAKYGSDRDCKPF